MALPVRRQYSIGVVRPRAPIRPDGSKLEQGGILPPSMQSQDPYLFPPPGSRAFNLSGPQAIVGINQLTTPAALAMALPNANVGVIDSIDIQLDGILPTSNVLWRVLVCGAPAPGWSITVPAVNGVVAAVKSWEHARIEIPLNGSIGVQILNVDGGAYTATTTYYGWFWPAIR